MIVGNSAEKGQIKINTCTLNAESECDFLQYSYRFGRFSSDKI